MKPSEKVGRNARCPCGGGKKFKKCCAHKDYQRRLQLVPMSHGDWGIGADADPKIRECWSDIQAWLDETQISLDKLYVDSNGGIRSFPAHGIHLGISAHFDAVVKAGPMWTVFRLLALRNPNIVWTACDDLILSQEFNSFQQEMKTKHGNGTIGGADSARARDIIKRRDEAIAENINRDLKAGEIGILFIGNLHIEDDCLVKLLSSKGIDVQIVAYTIGEIP